MILFLHNRYRHAGGEERAVEDLAWLVREQMQEPAEVFERDSSDARPARAAAALIRGGEAPREVGDAVRSSGARVLHAHNLQPLFGWRALAAARAAGAKVVLHLHQYRLVCAVGVCFTAGRECTRCHGTNTLPGVLHNCRGSRAEAVSYAAALALWQRRVLAQADAVVVPSAFAAERLLALGVALPQDRVHVVAPPLRALAAAAPGAAEGRRLDRRRAAGDVPPPRSAGVYAPDGRYALVVSRLAPEKGIETAIDACARLGRPLVIAGDGPMKAELRRRAEGARWPSDSPHAKTAGMVRFTGRVCAAELARLRARAAVAVVPSRSAETFGIAAAEALAAGLPVVASAVGALPELVEPAGLVRPGDCDALALAIRKRWGDEQAARRGRARIAELCAPAAVAAQLGEVYERVCAGRGDAHAA